MKERKVNSIEEVYGQYASEDFVRMILRTSQEAQERIKAHLQLLTKADTLPDSVTTCVNGEIYWKAIEKECREWLHDQ